MRKPSILSSPTWLLPARITVKAVFAATALASFAGCATNPNNDVLVDPLKQRLIAREDIALQNLMLERSPVYSSDQGGWDAPYDGPAVEPPLPDLSLLPEDLPPWEEIEQLPSMAGDQEDALPVAEPAPQDVSAAQETPQPTDSVQ
jgi:hypothetical protein